MGGQTEWEEIMCSTKEANLLRIIEERYVTDEIEHGIFRRKIGVCGGKAGTLDGRYSTLEEAVEVSNRVYEQLGYTARHGGRD